MEKAELNPLQLKLLDLLKWFHEFCVENNLRYYAIGGTMLGAMRHEGFIPWDDDIDLGMPRKDYERFLDLTEGKSIGQYKVESMRDGNDDFTYLFAKVYDTKTTLIERRKKIVKRGVYLDIYPIDGTGNNLAESKAFYSSIERSLNFQSARVSAFRKGRSLYKNMAVFAVRIISPFLPNVKKQMAKIDSACKSRDFDTCEFAANLYGLKRSGEIMPRSYFGTPTLCKFENISIYGVEKYDEFLTHIYGNWRELPPKDKQITHHDFVLCDLTKSYLDD